MTDVDTSFQSLNQQRAAALTRRFATELAQPGSRITRPPEAACLSLPSQSCVAQIVIPGGSPPIRVSTTLKDQKAIAVAGALDDYGKALVSLAAAKDVASEKAAMSKAASALVALTTALGPAGAAVSGVVQGAAFIAGKVEDYSRLVRLRKIVGVADPAVAVAAKILADDATSLQQEVIASDLDSASREVDVYLRSRNAKGANPASNQNAANKIIADYDQIDQLASMDVMGPFTKMAQAHAALLKALKNPQLSFLDAVKLTNDFLTEAAQLILAAPAKTRAK